MAITLFVKEIRIQSHGVGSKPETYIANVDVVIVKDQSRSLEMGFAVSGYENLDDATEKVRQQILEFATQLQEAAKSPLPGTRRGQ